MSRLLTVAAIAAVTAVTAVVGYVAYRVKTGKSTVSVSIKDVDAETSTETAAPASETVDPLVVALKALADKEIREYVEYLQVTKPRMFEDVVIEFKDGFVGFTKADHTVWTAELFDKTGVTEALEKIQDSLESK